MALRAIAAKGVGQGLIAATWVVTAARGEWLESEPTRKQRIYFANHVSHGDFVLIWSVLPPRLREIVRPVAGSDYWLKSKMRRFFAHDVFNALLIDRNPETRDQDPMEVMKAALGAGDSIIIFPEGTRNMTDDALLEFKSGIYNLAKAHPDIELVPVWIDNLNAVLPKGAIIPIPILCTVKFGKALHLKKGEKRENFLKRARNAMLALAGETNDAK